MIINSTPTPATSYVKNTTMFTSTKCQTDNSEKKSNSLRNALMGLALLGATLVPTSCSTDSFDDMDSDLKKELVANNAISEDCLDEQEGINAKANFIFHQLGLIDEDKRIADISELSFTDGKGEKYVFNHVGEGQYGPEFAGTAEGSDGIKRHAKLRIFQGNELVDNNVCLSTWHNGVHNDAYIKQVGWKYVDGKPEAVFHEFRTAVNSPERGKYGEYVYNKDNEFEIVKTADGFISQSIPGRNPGTPNEYFYNFNVKYKTGDEQEESIVSVVNPNDISTSVTYNYQP